MTGPRRLTLSHVLEGACLVAIVLLGIAIRWLPVTDAGGADFDGDRAFHLRMVEEVVRTGSVPARDPRVETPDGRPVAPLLPTVLYYLVAGYHALRGSTSTLGDIADSALHFTSVVGALIALPLFALARGLGLGPVAALAAALTAVAVPGHVHRTIAPWLRYDALGSLLVTTHVACVVLAITAARGRAFIWLTALAATTLVGAVASWRVALVLVVLESLIALGSFLVGTLRRPLLIVLSSNLAAVLIGSMLIPYLARGPHGPFIIGQLGALVFFTLGILLMDAPTGFHLERKPLARLARLGLVTLAISVALILGARGHGGAALIDALELRRSGASDAALEHTASANASATPGSEAFDASVLSRAARRLPAMGGALMATTTELNASTPRQLLDADFFGLLPLIAVVFLIGRLVPRGTPWLASPRSARGSPRQHWRDGMWIWHVITAVLVIATLTFARTKVLAAPFLALYPALVIAAAGRPRGRWIRELVPVVLSLAVAYLSLRGRWAENAGAQWTVVATISIAAGWVFIRMASGARMALLGLALTITAWTVAESFVLVDVLAARFDPTTVEILQVLNARARPGDAVLCDWGRGYTVQTHAGLPTVTDGFLESTANRERIAAYAIALYDDDPGALIEVCEQYGVRFIWVPGRRQTVQAIYAGVDREDYFAGGRPTALGRQSNYARLLWWPDELDCVRPLAAIGRDRLFAYDPDCGRSVGTR